MRKSKPIIVMPKLQISHAVVGGCIWMISGATVYNNKHV